MSLAMTSSRRPASAAQLDTWPAPQPISSTRDPGRVVLNTSRQKVSSTCPAPDPSSQLKSDPLASRLSQNESPTSANANIRGAFCATAGGLFSILDHDK